MAWRPTPAGAAMEAVQQRIKACEEELKALPVGGPDWLVVRKLLTQLRTQEIELMQQAQVAAQAPVPPAGVTVHVKVDDEDLGYNAKAKITLQASDVGQEELLDYMQRWDCWGLWDGVTCTPSGTPYIVSQVGGLQNGATYIAYRSSSKEVKRFVRQLQNAGRKHEPELEKAIVCEVSALGRQPVVARPDLCQLQSNTFSFELGAVALGEKIAVIAEHEETAAMTNDNTFAIVEDVCEKAQVVSSVANKTEFSQTKFAAFQGRQITPAVMYDYVDPKLQPALEKACTHKGVLLLVRNGKTISRVPAVRAVASLGTMRRLVQSSLVRLL